MRPVPNTYKVPKKMWNKWCNRARYVFNEVYSGKSMDSEDGSVADKCYWNAAVVAASEVNRLLGNIAISMREK